MLLFAYILAFIGLVTAHLTDFLLVTTTSPAASSNIAALPHVNATSLFGTYMFNSPNYYLRLIGPGYGSLPCFNLTDGFLNAQQPGPHGLGTYRYWSHVVSEHLPFWFNTERVETGGRTLELVDDRLLAVGGDVEGWMVCPGVLEAQVLVWKGNDTGCVKRYVQAVKQAPY